MKRISRTMVFLVMATVLLFSAAVALAQTGGVYGLTWHTTDGGGGVVSGGSYVLSGTAGQPDAATVSGGAYTLSGGFWSGVNGAAPPTPTPTGTPPTPTPTTTPPTPTPTTTPPPSGTQSIYLPLVIR
ncbi:MAG: hypothetical protein Fur0018_15350 [Anaerolineales bacterium]